MTSFRRVAFPLGLAAICGGALLFSLSTARGQTAAPPTVPSAPSGVTAPGALPDSSNTAAGGSSAGGTAAAPATTAGAPTLSQTIGVSPVQTRRGPSPLFGGTGNDTYDLQIENVYSLLRQRGVPIPNVLHPLSTAKPSFILERLIVLSLSGGSTANTSGAAAGSGSAPIASPAVVGAAGDTGAAAAATGPAEPTDAEKTVTAVRRVVDAELTKGTGRLGGAHRQKLLYLRNAIRSLEAANRLGAIVTQAVNGAQAASGASAGGATSGSKSDLDPREILYGQARYNARAADRYTPNIP